jgi:hypothetical protein
MTRSLFLVVTAAILVSVPQTARADIIRYFANLNGPSESPPNASPGVGSAEVDFDIVAHTMRVEVAFSGMSAPTTASHIHAATALPGVGTASVATTVPTFPGFPLGVTSGTYDQTFNTLDPATYNPAFVTANGGTAAGAEAALAAALASDRAYLNIHTTAFPGGEIRGFLVPAATVVPEPTSLALLGGGLVGLIVWRRRRSGQRGGAPSAS